MGKLRKIVSFDFDDTLCMADGTPNHRMIEVVWQHHEAGDKCYIVTARDRTHETLKWCRKNMPDRVLVKEFIREHNLPIKQCHFTNHEPKGPVLKRIGAVRHYDDKDDHLESAVEHGVEAIRSLPPT